MQTTDTPPEAGPFDAVLNEISTALVDMASALQESQAGTDGISAALADLAAAINAKGKPLEELAATIKALRPTITINVSPTPIHNHLPAAVVQILERQTTTDLDVHLVYDAHQRITGMRVKRLQAPVVSI
jgi:hypothetical protein